MMDLMELMSELKRQNIKIWLDGEKLRYRSLNGPLPVNLREQIKPHRQSIIDYLQHKNVEDRTHETVMPADRTKPLPVSFAEERLWFVSSINKNLPVFQFYSAYTILGKLNLVALRKSLDRLVSNHEILRTRYVFVDGFLTRQIDASDSFCLHSIPLACDESKSIDDTLLETLKLECSRKIDLSVEPGFSVRLIPIEKDRCVITFMLHHIVYDDLSISFLWQELGKLYGSFTSGNLASSEVKSLQYADFAYWQRNTASQRLSSRLTYWKSRLADVPPLLELPTDHKRPLHPSYAGAFVETAISDKQLIQIDQLCARLNLTRYMFLMAVFSLLLHRYSGQSTILIGSPVSNRQVDSFKDMLGCFLDTLVLRTDVSSEQTFKQLLQAVRKSTLDAFDNQQIPFETIVETLNPDRSSGAHPVFQVMFNYLSERSQAKRFAIPGCQVERMSLGTPAHADFDLKLTVVEDKGQLKCHFLYSTDLFLERTIQRMVEHFILLLDSALNSPNSSVAAIPLMTESERETLLVNWNATDMPYPTGKSLSELFEDQVQQHPQDVALIHNQDRVSFQSLNTQANQLARYLLQAGVKSQSVVGVYLPRSIGVSVALLATWKINAVYLPLDASYPVARIKHMLAISHASFIISVEEILRQSRITNIPSICLDSEADALKTMSSSGILAASSHEDLAYIVFTSGSTGMPKGVSVCHRQILNRLFWMWRRYPFNSEDVSCQKTAISFVDSLWELLGPLLSGSPSVVLNDEVVRDPFLMLRTLEENKVSRLWVVPTLLHMLIVTTKKHEIRVPSLNFVVSSGELLPLELAEEACAVWPQISLYNLYGTSEAWDSTWYEYTQSQNDGISETESSVNTVPIGKPIDNTQIYILDSMLNPVPIGVTGQLCVGGDGLANQLLRREGSDEGFVKNPWHPERQLYMTGDKARYFSDGNIELTGRDGGDFNVRGYRVNPAEVERVLGLIDGISKVAVMQQKGQAANSVLTAYVELEIDANRSENVTDTNLRQSLKSQLPQYMVPDEFMLLDTFPLTPSGKVDRRALGHGANMGSSLRATDQGAPVSALEADILEAWRRVLGKQSIGIYDNFFDVGGHSILAVTLFEHLNQTYKTNLELSLLFEAATVAEQAVILSGGTPIDSNTPLIPIRAGGKNLPLFFVPPAAGTGLNYRRLGAVLDDHQPIYTFDLSASSLESESSETITAMASRLVSEMRSIQPDGPYIVGGMCFGGVVAWEVAQQLQKMQLEVASVILLDSSLPFIGPGWSVQRGKPTLFSIFRRNLDDLWLHRFSRRSRQRVMRRAASKFLNRWNTNLRVYRELNHHHWRILSRYKADTCNVNTLMICSREFANRDYYLERWKTLIEGHLRIDVLDSATHAEMLTDNDRHMEDIGRKVQDYLESYSRAAN